MWTKATLLVTIASAVAIFGIYAFGQDVRSESFTHEDFLEACAYIEKNVDVKWTCKDVVEPELTYDMPDKWQAYFYAYTIRPDHHGELTLEEGGPKGKIVFEPQQTRDSIFWKGIFVHELCHHIDNVTEEGCKCDPFDLQYKYHHEQGEDQWKAQIWHGIKHDSHRVCYWRNSSK